ncbi:glycosyltransferase [Loktanella sp. D2R18]|uniref:glycosyltransferase n=1 Tax=Rhodobacterales TaxID=204455 RepID=UPI000DEB2E14|nr:MULTISPECIES: glycosyltransferase [Rhodobacterales]MDO6591919.1 glycosyltransferase [Yoonia sp. 1_MG-2023]RBW42649.1 glycosyltransferase [Loktanella sp. D2R18]
MLNALSHIAYLSIVVILAASVPAGLLGDVKEAAVVLGVLGAWRYSWASINFTRAAIFRLYSYPRRKARAHARYAKRAVQAHAYFLTTSYMIESGVTIPVYRSIFLAAAKSENGATIVSSVVDGADERLIQDIYATMPVDMSSVKLIVDRIPGTGKRDALAKSLTLIARECPSARDIVIFVDGDSCVPEDIVAQSAPIFTSPKVGALTTDEEVEIPDPGLFRDWFELRFDQRQVMMCSMGLGNRVLTLTGRMSVFRGDLATDPDFIRSVQHDFIDHWRLGRVNFLTGDDKSTWYWLMKNGYEMAYLPDVASSSMETQPKPTFVGSATALMVRWFGNMLRTNGRALELSPSQIGYFTWWSILDQRLSMWTTLAGPLCMIAAAVFFDPMVIPVYIAWVMFTRYVFCTAICLFRGRSFPIVYPALLYFGQLFGAIVKSYVLFRLDRQKWTRQVSAGPSGVRLPVGERLRAASSAYMHVLTLGWLTIAALYLTGVL